MNPMPLRSLFIFVAISIAGQNMAAGAQRCTTEFRLPLLLRLDEGAAPPTAAFLIGDVSPGLTIIEATSGRVLWTAAATGVRTQFFAGMTAGFSSSLAVLDTDGDGAHDRIYAGDLQGRLWRFDIDTSKPVSSWVAGGVFADLSAGTPGRGFIAAPDLALIAPAGMQPWLSIALGTANTSPGPSMAGLPYNHNRFYVLKDHAPFAKWTQRQYDRWTPLLDSDLLLSEGTQLDVNRLGAHLGVKQTGSAGYYINLGARQVAAASLTIDGNTFYTAVANSASLLPSCSAPPTTVVTAVTVGSIAAATGSLNALDVDARGIRAAPAGSAIALVRDEHSTTGKLVCEIAGNVLPGCAVDSALRRSFWRREDAD